MFFIIMIFNLGVKIHIERFRNDDNHHIFQKNDINEKFSQI